VLATRRHPGPSGGWSPADPITSCPTCPRRFTQATQADLAVAFIKTTGLRLCCLTWSRLEAGAPQRVRVLTSDYLDITDPEALRLLLLLQERGAEVRVYVTQEGSFHLKAYIFAKRLRATGWRNGVHRLQQHQPAGAAGRAGVELPRRLPGRPGFLEAEHASRRLFRSSEDRGRCPMPGSRPTSSGGSRRRDRDRARQP
jgi:hypothetical protein